MCCLYLLCLNTSMKDCITVLCKKKNHNAEKSSSVTMFGFEIKIMDKCCVCSKQPRISCRLLCESCFCTAHGPHTHCKRSMCEPGVKGHLTYSSWNEACAACKLLCNNCMIVKTKMHCMFKHLGEINICFSKMSKNAPLHPSN